MNDNHLFIYFFTSFIAIDERNNETVSEAQTVPQKRSVSQYYSFSLAGGKKE